MINISKLYCDQITPGDWLRYGKKNSGEKWGETVPEAASKRRPIVVWNTPASATSSACTAITTGS
jgi:hypothetical protein